MVKPTDEVISEWNELVNMTAAELKEWLGSEESTGAGWSKDDGSGETIGHESGRMVSLQLYRLTQLRLSQNIRSLRYWRVIQTRIQMHTKKMIFLICER